MDFWRKHTLSGSAAPHTHSHKELRETLESNSNAITQLDKYCINPGIQPPFPASHSIPCQLDTIAGETGSTGHCGSAPLLMQVWPIWFLAKMHFLQHVVCALLTDVKQTQPKFMSMCIIIHHSNTTRWQRIEFLTPPLHAWLILSQ